MAHFLFLGLQVAGIVGVGLGPDGELLDDLNIIGLEPYDFTGIVGEEPDFVDPEVSEDLGAEAVVPEVHGKAETLIGFDRIEALFLKLVSANFGAKADATTFLAHVKEDACTFFLDTLHGLVQLGAAVTTAGSKNIPSQTFTMDAHKRGFRRGYFPLHQRDMVHAINQRAVKVEVEIPEVSGHENSLLALDQSLALAAMCDEVLDRTHFKSVLAFEFDQIWQAGHGTVLFHDLADDSGGIESGKPREIDSRLGMPSAAEHPPVLGLEGEDMAGLDEIAGERAGVGKNADRRGTVFYTDASGGSRSGIDRYGEVRFEKLAVPRDHSLKPKAVGTFRCDRHTDKSASEFHHEIDGGWGDFGSGHDQVPFIFAVGIVGHDDHSAAFDVCDDLWNRVEWFFHAGWKRYHTRALEERVLRSSRKAAGACDNIDSKGSPVADRPWIRFNRAHGKRT